MVLKGVFVRFLGVAKDMNFIFEIYSDLIWI